MSIFCLYYVNKHLRLAIAGLLIAVVGVLAACASAQRPPETTAAETAPAAPPREAAPPVMTVAPATTAAITPPPVMQASSPFPADGNHLYAGSSPAPSVAVRDVPLSGTLVWVTGSHTAMGIVWAVAYEDGRIEGIRLTSNEVEPFDLGAGALPAGMPPVLLTTIMEARLLAPPGDASPLAPPLVLADGRLAYVGTDGAVALVHEDGTTERLDVDALPDARLVTDGAGRLLVLTGPTDRYAHAVLGDGLEATSITLLDTEPGLRVVRTFDVPGSAVVEGLAPLWADLDGDGAREVVVTLSDARQGARLVVFDEEGAALAEGPAVGSGFRWRHQIAVGAFGPAGEIELVDVLTPHIDGVVEFFRWEGDRLVRAAELPGYTSHVIGSRNLEMAAAADFNGDGQVELLVPTQDRTALTAIRRTEAGAEAMWSLPLDGQMVTNLAVVPLQSGNVVFAAGRADGTLRVWMP